jgi:hypothetical protein
MFERYINNKSFKEIPGTDGKYFITIDGIIKTKDYIEVPVLLNELGDKVVNLKWITALCEIEVYKLIAFTFKPIFIPIEFWEQLNVLFKDGRRCNLHPSNLVWKFPIGLGADVYGGYAFIPMYTRYLINKDGHIKSFNEVLGNTTRSKFKLYGKENSYHQHTVQPDIGAITTLLNHRALGLAWLDYNEDVDDMVINHIDGLKHNNYLSNLEWCTDQENIVHAVENNLIRPGLKQSVRKRVKVRDVITGEVKTYLTINATALGENIKKDSIQYRLGFPSTKIFSELKQYKLAKDETPWYIPTETEIETLVKNRKTLVDVRYVSSGIIKTFLSQRDCAKEFCISEATLSNWLKLKNQPILPPLIQIKFTSDKLPWRIPIDLSKEIEDMHSKKIILMKNIETHEVKQFFTLTECAKYLNVLKTTLHWWTQTSGRKICNKKYLFKYKSDPTPWLEF